MTHSELERRQRRLRRHIRETIALRRVAGARISDATEPAERSGESDADAKKD